MDDVASNRDILVHMLDRVGVIVASADSGPQALAHVRRRCPDIVFMDIRMPGMDGEETRRLILEEVGDRAPKIVAVTASVLDHERRRLLDAGFDGFIDKPVRSEQLYEALARSLGVTFTYLERMPAAPPKSLPTTAVPADLHRRLREAVLNSSVTDLRKGIDEMEEMGGDSQELAAVLRQLARQYDMGAISDLLSQVRSE